MAGGLFIIGFVFLLSTPAVEEVLTLKETSEDASLQSRILVWRHTAQMISDYPFLGSGPGTYATIFTQYQPPGILGRYYMAHNDYLHFISEAGIPLIVIMAWMIVGLYSKRYYQAGPSEPPGKGHNHWSVVRNIRHLVLQHFRFQPPHPGQCDLVHRSRRHCGITRAGKRKADGA